MVKSVAYVALVSAAILLGSPVSMAEKVSPAVAKTLQAAQNASKARKWSECLSELRQAEANPGKTGYDQFVINELRAFCALSSNDVTTALKAYEDNLASSFIGDRTASRVRDLTKLHFNARNYDKSIEFGQRAIKEGFADADTYLVVAQSYYQKNDYRNARDFVGNWIKDMERRGQRPRENALNIYVTSCMRLKDDACTSAGFEKLVTYYPKPDSWANLMQALFRSRSEAAAFNAFRLATEVGAMRAGDDYTELAQRALERGLANEAQKALETAFGRNAFKDKRDIDRNTRLLNSAKQRAASERAGLAKADRDAAAGKDGNADLRVGQSYLSFGQFPQAVAAIERGIAKGNVTNPAEAQLILGIAQSKAGNKAAAARAFRAVKTDDADLNRVTKLWSLRAQ
ncbi:MAG: hypothetical protein ACO3CV_04195 [Steroidobacteraceae bacterium]